MCFTITMLQYYICLGVVLTVLLVLGLGLWFGIILYFVIGACGNGPSLRRIYTVQVTSKCGTTLYVGMAQGVSFSLYIGIGVKYIHKS